MHADADRNCLVWPERSVRAMLQAAPEEQAVNTAPFAKVKLDNNDLVSALNEHVRPYSMCPLLVIVSCKINAFPASLFCTFLIVLS